MSGALAQTGISQTIDEFLTRAQSFGFSGSILVARHGQVLLAKGYGWADRDRGNRYSRETVFPIGSITKQFTAAAILKLEMGRRLNTSDPISKYLPGVPVDKSVITIHQLLTHTSGLQSDFGQDYDIVTRDELLRKVLASKLSSEPGKEFAYSNAGYGLLAAIVEIVSGVPYERFLHDNFFVPTAMAHTGGSIPTWDRSRIVHGYVDGKDVGTSLDKMSASAGPFWNLVGNGGLLSTLDDLNRWDRALKGTITLSNKAKQELFTLYVSHTDESDKGYAYGWYVSSTPLHRRLISHTGGDGVFFASIRRYVDDDAVIIASSNVASQWAEYVVRGGVEDILLGKPYTMPPRVVAMPSRAKSLVGRFRLDPDNTFEVAIVHDELRVTPTGQEAFRIMTGAPPGKAALLAEVQERTAILLRERDHGDFAPLQKALSDGSTLADLENSWEGYQSEQKSAWGKYTGFNVLGSQPGGSWVLTHVRLNFEHGQQLLDYLWNGERLVGIQFSSYPGYFVTRPISPNSFASYDIRSGQSVRLDFVSEHGVAKSLILTGVDQSHTAAREP
jgi:CubicO group peptidase (beta-lactamase class C family)